MCGKVQDITFEDFVLHHSIDTYKNHMILIENGFIHIEDNGINVYRFIAQTDLNLYKHWKEERSHNPAIYENYRARISEAGEEYERLKTYDTPEPEVDSTCIKDLIDIKSLLMGLLVGVMLGITITTIVYLTSMG